LKNTLKIKILAKIMAGKDAIRKAGVTVRIF